MIRNFLKIAFRQLWKHKMLTGINLIGLAAAIGGSLLLLLTSFFHFSFDNFHENSDRLYRLYIEVGRSTGTERGANLAAPLMAALREEVPEIEHAARWVTSGATVDMDKKLLQTGIRYTDPDFFRMFSFPLLQGDPGQVLAGLNSVVLSERTAKNIFGEGVDPMGKTVRVIHGAAKDYVVSGVVADAPENSSLEYSMITRFENYPDYPVHKDRWDNQFTGYFVQLAPGRPATAAEEHARSIIRKYQNGEAENILRDGGVPDAAGDVLRYKLQPLRDLHFDTTVDRSGVSRALPAGLILLSLFVLGIACINFVNLTLGTSIGRAREVGVRKVLGASRGQLLTQFWGETLVMVALAMLAGLALAQLVLPGFNATFRADLNLVQPNLLGAIALILAFIGLAGGGYPALLLSRFQPARVLKGDTEVQRPGRLRNGLILVQFTLSVLLISCTIIVTQQLNYLRNKPLGYNKDLVVSVPMAEEVDTRLTVSRMRNELARYPEVRGVTAGYRNFGVGTDGSTVTSMIGFDQNGRGMVTFWVPVDYNYLETLEIPLAAGRDFDRDRGSDSTEAILINETFAQQLGGVDTALGMVLNLEPRRTIVGITKDFHYQSLESPIGPLSFVLPDTNFRLNYLFVRIAPENMPQTMARIEQTWKQINPQSEYQGSFLNENNNRMYEAEQAMGRIFSAAAILAIVLSCMGLFGVALLVIAQRTKEIGVRKVLGATTAQIVGLITGNYVIIVGVAFLIATPLAWWAMNTWLKNYAYRIGIEWWVFPLAGILALLIALATLSWQSIQAARANPVEALRDE